MIQNFEYFPNYAELKEYLLLHNRPTPNPTYGIFDPYLRHIFQLRVGLSKLRYHKKRHNFADTVSEICSCTQGIEDVKHFLLHCSYYANYRNTLLNNVNLILNGYDLNINDFPHLLLYGHSDITPCLPGKNFASEPGAMVSATLCMIYQLILCWLHYTVIDKRKKIRSFLL